MLPGHQPMALLSRRMLTRTGLYRDEVKLLTSHTAFLLPTERRTGLIGAYNLNRKLKVGFDLTMPFVSTSSKYRMEKPAIDSPQAPPFHKHLESPDH
jgi:hypothetical protein